MRPAAALLALLAVAVAVARAPAAQSTPLKPKDLLRARRALHAGWTDLMANSTSPTDDDDDDDNYTSDNLEDDATLGWPEMTPADREEAAASREGWTGRSSADYPMLVVPVAFHILVKSDGVTGFVPYNKLVQQVAQLNRAFQGQENNNANSNAKLQFVLFSVDYTVSDEWHNMCALWNYQPVIKQALAVNPAQYYNVYSCHATSSLGLSWIPYQAFRMPGTSTNVVPAENSFILGTILDWQLFPGSDMFNGRWSQGDILAHETGHHFGLMHIYEGGCVGTEQLSDMIDDTPRQNGNPSGTCAQLAGLDSCNVPCPGCPGNQRGLDDNSNYMGIAADACRDHFTPGQVDFMRSTIAQYKPTLLKQLPLGCVAAIDSTDQSPDLAPCVGQVFPAGTGGKSKKWCVTSSSDSTQWGYACCGSDGNSCRTGTFSLDRASGGDSGGSSPTRPAKPTLGPTNAPTVRVPAASNPTRPPAARPTGGRNPNNKPPTPAPTTCTWKVADSQVPCEIPFNVQGRRGVTAYLNPIPISSSPPFQWTSRNGATSASLWCPQSGVATYSPRSAAVKNKWGLAVCV